MVLHASTISRVCPKYSGLLWFGFLTGLSTECSCGGRSQQNTCYGLAFAA